MKILTKYRTYIITILIILTSLVLALYLMGRSFQCSCGYIKLWHSEAASSENSQHLFDPYSFTHVLHGFLYYFILWVFVKRLPLAKKFLLVLSMESIWEIIENTPFVIERYRSATVSFNYYGDSIVNSLGDVLAMFVGFILAANLSVIFIIFMLVLIEVLLAYFVRDNLTLNLLNLIRPSETIRNWQESK